MEGRDVDRRGVCWNASVFLLFLIGKIRRLGCFTRLLKAITKQGKAFQFKLCKLGKQRKHLNFKQGVAFTWEFAVFRDLIFCSNYRTTHVPEVVVVNYRNSGVNHVLEWQGRASDSSIPGSWLRSGCFLALVQQCFLNTALLMPYHRTNLDS